MLYIFVCTCAGSERLARKVLKKSGYKDWLNINVIKGKEKSLEKLANLPAKYVLNPSVCALNAYIKNKSKYVVIFGYGDNIVRWTDVASGGVKEQIDADIIVNKFA